jgi:putative ATPase
MSGTSEPLASRIRPVNLDEYVGQSHLVGEGKPLKMAIENGKLFSMIFWGPPGVGKTTLARIYANSLGTDFYELSAVNAGKKDIRSIIEKVIQTESQQKVLFLDEIHRFNKAQQDFLLPYVEQGVLTLIGATTENPSFEVIGALLSRCRVFVLNALTDEEMRKILERTGQPIPIDALEWLISYANGDARQALSCVDNTLALYGAITLENVQNGLQTKTLRYDKGGEEHYNLISAFIKSMRAGEVDATLYYLARMVESGEDPKFIARRMIIFASEDIGLAQSTALVVANEVFEAVIKIGLPEAQINLAHGASYLAKCPKNRQAYEGYFRAMDDVKNFGEQPVSMHLRNAPTKLLKEIGYGKAKAGEESFLPAKLKNRKYWK